MDLPRDEKRAIRTSIDGTYAHMKWYILRRLPHVFNKLAIFADQPASTQSSHSARCGTSVHQSNARSAYIRTIAEYGKAANVNVDLVKGWLTGAYRLCVVAPRLRLHESARASPTAFIHYTGA